MKINFSNRNFVGDDVRSLTSSGLPQEIRDSSPRLLHSRRSGIALIITLILLSVTLVMALAFLAISRRESSSVVTAADTAAARLAADSALASAEAQVMANILSTTNPYNFVLLVSTNFINGNGFDPTLGTNNPNNVNYDNVTAASGGGPLSQPEQFTRLERFSFLSRPEPQRAF
jgi:hypothetical protein